MAITLNYHRCHGRDCEGKHAVKSFTAEAEERKHGWKRCKCPIVASGTLSKKSKRMATKQTDWKAAAVIMTPYLAAGSWDLEGVPKASLIEAPEEEGASPKSRGLMIEAVAAFLADHKKHNSAFGTIGNHKSRLNLALHFCRRKGIVKLDQWTPELVKAFLAESEVEAATAHVYHAEIKAFMSWCIRSGWRSNKENPAAYTVNLIRNVATSAARGNRQKFAFTDHELNLIYRACEIYDNFSIDAKGDLIPTPATVNRAWTGEDVGHFAALLSFTGMRISNVAKFHIDSLKGADQVHIRTIKGNVPVYTSVPLWLADIIRERAAKFGPYIFGQHNSADISVFTKQWRGRLRTVWEICAQKFGHEWTTKPTPHRFRHTFARVLLQAGKSPATVAQLMGNTEAVVIEYYGGWVAERQEKLSAMMREVFENTPSPMAARKGGTVRLINAG